MPNVPPAYQVVRLRREDDIVNGVTGSPGHKYTPLVGIVGDGVRMLKVPNDEVTKYAAELEDYTPAKFAKKLLAAGRRMGITKEAKDFLKEIA